MPARLSCCEEAEEESGGEHAKGGHGCGRGAGWGAATQEAWKARGGGWGVEGCRLTSDAEREAEQTERVSSERETSERDSSEE